MLDLLAALATTTAATMPSTAPTTASAAPAVASTASDTFGLSGPVLAALIAAGTSALVALLNLRYQSVATRLKTYLEAYKVAKDAGLATEADERWARNVLRTIHNDTMIKPNTEPFGWLARWVVFFAVLVVGVSFYTHYWPPHDFWLVYLCTYGVFAYFDRFVGSWRKYRRKSLIAQYPTDDEAAKAKRL